MGCSDGSEGSVRVFAWNPDPGKCSACCGSCWGRSERRQRELVARRPVSGQRRPGPDDSHLGASLRAGWCERSPRARRDIHAWPGARTENGWPIMGDKNLPVGLWELQANRPCRTTFRAERASGGNRGNRGSAGLVARWPAIGGERRRRSASRSGRSIRQSPPQKLPCPSAPGRIAWSADGKCLVASRGRLDDYSGTRLPVRSDKTIPGSPYLGNIDLSRRRHTTLFGCRLRRVGRHNSGLWQRANPPATPYFFTGVDGWSVQFAGDSSDGRWTAAGESTRDRRGV